MLLAEDWGPLVYQTILIVFGIPFALIAAVIFLKWFFKRRH